MGALRGVSRPPGGDQGPRTHLRSTHGTPSIFVSSRLQEPNRDTLVLYARFIGDTADYVVNQLIDSTIAKDREFLAWRATQQGGANAPSPGSDPGASRRSRVEDLR